MAWVLPVLVAVIIWAVLKWIWDRRSTHTTWEKLGVKGPKASSLFFGHLLEINSEGRLPLTAKWTKKYGKVFGFYEGGTPVLEVADPDMVREILIKQFHNFETRKLLSDNTMDPFVNLVESDGERWKRVRGISSPTFSGRKMKMMSPLIHRSIDKLMQRLEQRVTDDKAFDIHGDMKCLTLDVIASTVFSYDTDVFNTKDSTFLKHLTIFFDCLDLQRMKLSTRLMLMLFTVFPRLDKLAKVFAPRITAVEDRWFLEFAKRVITDRQSSGERRADYIQLMLDTQKKSGSSDLPGSETDTDLSDNEIAVDLRRKAKSKFLTMNEMQAQTVTFLAAGYETTATTLAFLAHYLALYPDVQAKLQQEIDEHFPVKGQNINYETVQKLAYLDMVFCEVSRLAYIAQLAVSRMCKETVKIGDVIIPKGAKVFINVEAIHMNPDLWGPEPVDEFVPERFLPDRKGARHSMAYLPFGAGPRNCIGMRFAIMESKMALINMLQSFTIMKCEKTQVPLKCTADGAHGPSEGVFVRLSKRQ